MQETKSIRLQVLIEPSLFTAISQAVREKQLKIGFRSDSDMIRYILQDYINLSEYASINTYRLENIINQERKKNAELQATIDVLEHTLEEKKKGPKEKKKVLK
jgi:hypothetical protein